QAQLMGGIKIRIEQGGSSSMDLANLGIGRATVTGGTRGRDLLQASRDLLFNRLLDDAQGERFVQTGRVFGQKGDHVAAILKDALLVEKDVGRKTAQGVGPTLDQRTQKAHADKMAIGQDKHSRVNRAQQ